jgi:uncharacterized protein YcbK (DUF882 family)
MCECRACAARPLIGFAAGATRPVESAAPLTRRALLGGALATTVAIASSAAAQSVPSLISPGDEPLWRDPLWVEGLRSNGRIRRRRRVPVPPIASTGPLSLQWPSGLSQRRLMLRNPATGESFAGVIWADGRFDDAALAQLNRLMRDSHSGTVTDCDVHLFELLACVQVRVGKPFNLVSGYRTLQTNTALARRDPHVARNSFHIAGKAADFTVEGVAPRALAQKAREVGAGGVGLYVGESFIHVDTGPMRSWVY